MLLTNKESHDEKELCSLDTWCIHGAKLCYVSNIFIYLLICPIAHAMLPLLASCPPMFKIEVFNALQTRFGPSKRNLKLKMKTSLEVLNILCLPQEPTSVGHCQYMQ